jgi:hypothetical protein
MDYCCPAMVSNISSIFAWNLHGVESPSPMIVRNISSIFAWNLHGFATECTEMQQKYTKNRLYKNAL